MENPIDRPIFIKEIIRQIHNELIEAENERKSSKHLPLFKVNNLTVEVNFTISNTDEINGGFNLKIISAGGKQNYSEQQVHKIILNLSSIDENTLDNELSDLTTGLRPRED